VAPSLQTARGHGCQEEDLHRQEDLHPEADDQASQVERPAHVEGDVDPRLPRAQGAEADGLEEADDVEEVIVLQRNPNEARVLSCSSLGDPRSSRTT